jgi:hypothetical protein
VGKLIHGCNLRRIMGTFKNTLYKAVIIRTLLLILEHFKPCPLQGCPFCWQYTIPDVSFAVGMLSGTHYL